MSSVDPIEMLYGDLDTLAPGSDADTEHVLDLLPKRTFSVVVDAGCGTGRQSMVLAQRLQTPVQALDVYEPFLERLRARARAAGLHHLIRPRCMDMADIPEAFSEIDLLWCEGAVYNIGFDRALDQWRDAVKPDGFLVISELVWLSTSVPETVREFFDAMYPAMRTVDENLQAVEKAGYRLVFTHPLPRETWVKGYYGLLGPKAAVLLDHPDEAVRALAAENLEEIRIFEMSEDCYGYVFFVMQKK